MLESHRSGREGVVPDYLSFTYTHRDKCLAQLPLLVPANAYADELVQRSPTTGKAFALMALETCLNLPLSDRDWPPS